MQHKEYTAKVLKPLEDESEVAIRWFIINHIIVNTGKFFILSFQLKKEVLKIKISEKQILQVMKPSN